MSMDLTAAQIRALIDIAEFGHAIRVHRTRRGSDWTWRVDGKPCSGPVDKLISKGLLVFHDPDFVVVSSLGRSVLAALEAKV